MKRKMKAGQNYTKNAISTESRNPENSNLVSPNGVVVKLVDCCIMMLQMALRMFHSFRESLHHPREAEEQSIVPEVMSEFALPQRTLDKMGWSSLDKGQRSILEKFLVMDTTGVIAPATLMLLAEGIANEDLLAALLRNYEDHVDHPEAAKFIRRMNVLRLIFSLAGLNVETERIRAMQRRLEMGEYRKNKK